MREALTTRPGFVNRHRQQVQRKVDWVDGGMAGQSVYLLRCQRPGCGHQYGEEGIRLHQRRCPQCDGGEPGLPVPPDQPSLFDRNA